MSNCSLSVSCSNSLEVVLLSAASSSGNVTRQKRTNPLMQVLSTTHKFDDPVSGITWRSSVTTTRHLQSLCRGAQLDGRHVLQVVEVVNLKSRSRIFLPAATPASWSNLQLSHRRSLCSRFPQFQALALVDRLQVEAPPHRDLLIHREFRRAGTNHHLGQSVETAATMAAVHSRFAGATGQCRRGLRTPGRLDGSQYFGTESCLDRKGSCLAVTA